LKELGLLKEKVKGLDWEMMNKYLHAFLFILALVVAAYVGGYLMSIGGIMQIINEIRNDMETYKFVVGVLRVIFALPVARLTFGILYVIPTTIINEKL